MLQEEIRKQESTASAETLQLKTELHKAPSPKRQENNSLLEVFPDIIGTSSAEFPSPTKLDCYLLESVIDCKLGKPLAWWTDHHGHYPTLSLMAKRYLSTTATSLPSETVFYNKQYL